MSLDTDVNAANSNGAEPNGRAGVWSRLEGARGALVDQTRTVAGAAGRQLTTAQRKVVGTVKEKPVTVSLATAGLALLAAGAVFALRNPELVKGLGRSARKVLRR